MESVEQPFELLPLERTGSAYRELVTLPAGRIVLVDVLRFGHFFQTIHCFDHQGRLDPIASAQLEGRRQVALRWVGFAGSDASALYEMARQAELDFALRRE